jgi:anti-sigma regulatory factor (Ser/Thr protein kinase)
MATVELRFGALPAHVRTARLVAAAVARRGGVEDGLIDEVKLAVGEACARALALHLEHAPLQEVVVELSEGPGEFVVTVRDAGPADGVASIPAARTEDLPALLESSIGADDGAASSAPLQLALIAGLVDELTVARDGDHTNVRMRWSLDHSPRS